MTQSPMIQSFMRQVKARNRATKTIGNLESALFNAEEKIGKPLNEASFDDLLTYIEGLKGDLSDNTIALHASKLIQFYKFCFDETDDVIYNKLVKKIKSISSGIKGKYISPSDILLPEDIKKLINVATLERDRCIIAVLFESGMRIGELLSLTNSMVMMDEKNNEVTFNVPDVEGNKTGGRTVVCLEIYGFCQDWQKCNTSDMFMPMSRSGLKKMLIRLFKKAKVAKSNNPHSFRHASITNAVNLNMSQSSISMRYWGIVDSNMLSTYVHLSEQMQATSYRNAKGMGNGDAPTVINPIASKCVNCGKLIQKGNLCIQCEENAQLKEKVKILENSFQDMINVIIESKDEKSFSKMKVKLQEVFNREPDVDDIDED